MNEQNNYADNSNQNSTAEQQPQYSQQQQQYQQPQYQQPQYQPPQQQYQQQYQQPQQYPYQQPQPYQQYQIPRPMGWYNAYKVIALIMGILGCISTFFMLVFTFILTAVGTSSDPSIPYEVQAIFGMLSSFMWPILLSSILAIVLNFVIYSGLKSYRRHGLIAIYIQTACMIVIPLFSMFLLRGFMDDMTSFIYSIDPRAARDMSIDTMYSTSMISSVFSMLFYGALYTLNAVYFHKRKDVFR